MCLVRLPGWSSDQRQCNAEWPENTNVVVHLLTNIRLRAMKACHWMAGLVTVVFVSTAAAAGWAVETERDSMTDQVRKSATIRNASGFKLSFYRVADASVWMLFALPTDSADVLGSPLPMYRIDKLKPNNMEESKEQSRLLKKPMFQAEPRWVNERVWHGQGEPTTGILRDFMEGQSVTFRYWLFTGGYKETTFDIRGGKSALADALGVPANPSPEAVRSEKERQARLDRCNAKFPLAGGDPMMIRKHLDCMREGLAGSSK